MDFATIIGIVAGFGLIVGSIMMDGSLAAYANGPGLVIVVGGTFAATLINQKFKYVLGAFSVAKNALVDRMTPISDTVETIHELVQTSRKEGVLGLEKVEIADPFLASARDMAVDGLELEFILTTLRRNLGAIEARHQRGQQIFKFMAKTAPAMGMIGTLIGLVAMLQTLDDPSAIGPAMAIALLTTLYGAILAFLVFGPLGEKLEARTKEELLRGNLAIAGIESVVQQDNKGKTEMNLNAYLAPKDRRLPEEKS